MRKFIIFVTVVILCAMTADTLYYRMGVYIDTEPNKPVSTFVKADEEQIYIDKALLILL